MVKGMVFLLGLRAVLFFGFGFSGTEALFLLLSFTIFGTEAEASSMMDEGLKTASLPTHTYGKFLLKYMESVSFELPKGTRKGLTVIFASHRPFNKSRHERSEYVEVEAKARTQFLRSRIAPGIQGTVASQKEEYR